MFVIGTAGHVDHGKSLLVERLTGIDPDRLDEEKRRGMTIDLGFAWMTLPSGRDVSIIDVPGHERFIKNMLAGAGGVDLALLVVAADDGVMPQTREHLAIVDLLGVRHGVVALSKADLVDESWLEAVRGDIEMTLRGTSLAGAPIVVCSSITGAGFDELRGAIDATLDRAEPRDERGSPRLPIDRAFTVEGFGAVVTGTLIDGSLRVGDEVEAMPDGLRGRVRGLQSHKQAAKIAQPGGRVAVNISGIPAASLRRGQVLARPGTLGPVTAVDVALRAVTGSRAVRHNMHVTFHSGSAEALAQVRLLEHDELTGGNETWGQIKVAHPLALLAGDRFVIRTPNETIGGGMVVAVNPGRHRRRDSRVVEELARRAGASPEELVMAALEELRIAGFEEIAARTGLHADAVASAIDALVERRDVLQVGRSDRFATATATRQLHEQAIVALTGFHERHPLRPGMSVEELRRELSLSAGDLHALAEGWQDVRVAGSSASLATFAPRLDGAQEEEARAFLESLRSADPPGNVPDQPTPDVLRHLVDRGEVVDAGEGTLFEREVFDGMVETVRSHLAAHESLTLAEARTLLRTNRRYAQAFLEHLDRRSLTRRVGDVRVWRGAS